MTDIPSPLTYATITGKFVSIMADSNDDGSAPDLTNLSGTVTIVPSVRRIHIIGADDGTGSEIAIAQTVTGQVVDGQLLGPDGVTPLRILATDSPGINPISFQYTASFSLTGAAAQPGTITFNALGGTVVDLTSVIPADSSPAIQTVVSEASRIAAAASATAAAASAAAAAASAEDAIGLPGGGTTGQALVKASNADADVEWGNVTVDLSDYVTDEALATAIAGFPLDTAVVHKTGAETIAGVKTFSSAPVVPSASFPESAITSLVSDLALKAPLASPALTGSPTAPTATAGDNDTSIATTAFVTGGIATAVATETSRAETAEALLAPKASPTFTGTPAGPTATLGTNSTQVATTAFVKAAIDALVAGAPGALDTLNEIATQLGTDESAVAALTTTVSGKVPSTRTVNGHALSADVVIAESDISGLTSDLAAKAPLASPTLTGTPAAPTATAGTNTTQVATTAYATAADAIVLAAAVQLTGAQTVAGVKTFSSQPIVPTPTASGSVSTKGYVDAFVAGYANMAPTTGFYVDYNFGTSSYPVRPTSRTDLIAIWRGPTQPTAGGGYSLANDEYRVKTS